MFVVLFTKVIRFHPNHKSVTDVMFIEVQYYVPRGGSGDMPML